MTKRLPRLAMAALILVGACNDNRLTQPPQRPSLTGPEKSISDGFHGGNPNFFFLVPTLPFSSGGNFKLGQFNPKLQPEVVICKLDPSSFANGFPTASSTCASTTADLTFASGAVHVVITPASTFETSLQKTYTLPADGFYYALWNTQGANLTKGSYYRISVQSNGGPLGFVDITPEPLGTGLFQLLNVVTNQVVPTLQNGTVPIAFRIQNGATCYPVASCIETSVTNTGTDKVNGVSGTLVTAPSGNNDGKDGAKAFFPNGFLNNVVDASGHAITSVVVTIKQVTPSVAQDCHNPTANPQLLQFLNCYNFSVSPMPVNAWATPVTVTTCPVLLSTSTVGELTQLFASDNGGAARPLPPSRMPLNCAGGAFDAPVGIGLMKSGNPVLRLAGNALNAVGKGLSRLFGPRELLAWDAGVGGFDAGPGFSNIGWGMLPNVVIQAPPTATAGAIVPVTATVTTNHNLGSPQVEQGVPVSGLAVSFSANGGALSATADGAGAGPTVSVVTNGTGTAVAYLTVSGNPANNIIRASIKDPAQINTVVAVQDTVVGSVIPAPAIALKNLESRVAGDGPPFTYFDLTVTNRAQYPDALFAPSPNLAACGENTQASRTWVDIFGDNSRVNGFCALGSGSDLDGIWFATPSGGAHPNDVYLTLTDRLNNQVYTSNHLTLNPVLALKSEVAGDGLTTYNLTVSNRATYPDVLFAASPNLPACGENTSASRTWVNIYDGGGNYVYGFCSLGAANDLDGIWFAIPTNQSVPAQVYITLTDRLTGTVFTSNLINILAP